MYYRGCPPYRDLKLTKPDWHTTLLWRFYTYHVCGQQSTKVSQNGCRRKHGSSTRMTTLKQTTPMTTRWAVLTWWSRASRGGNEIACSQDGRELDKAVWTYIPYSNANIKVVVGFELGYSKNKEAQISMWQPRYLKEGDPRNFGSWSSNWRWCTCWIHALKPD